VVKWSAWVALSTCLYYQVGNYIQPLWETILPTTGDEEVEIYNGAVEAVATLTGALTVFLVGHLKGVKWVKYGDLAIFGVTTVGGSALFTLAYTNEIFVAYAGYVIFRMSYNMMMTVASFEIARNLKENSYGLVFGINTWMGLGVQTALTLTVADSKGLNLDPRDQFFVYSGYYVIVGILFASYYIARRLVCKSSSPDEVDGKKG
jgi:thiamine transporter 2/3